jgi:hypothetical protein
MSSRLTSFPPDIICIGSQKACTSWLNLLLKSDRNKNVFIPYLKETFYLNLLESSNAVYPCSLSDLHASIYRLFKHVTESHIFAELDRLQHSDIQRSQSEYLGYLFRSLTSYWSGLDADWYQHLFSLASPGQLLCEITPDYSLIGSDLIEELASLKPGLKIILISRNPVNRDLSQLRMQLLPENPSPSEQECFDFLVQPHVRARSDYGGIMNRWIRYFGESSILTFDASEVSSSPLTIVSKINAFIQVDIDVDSDVLFARDNIGPQVWDPPHSVISFLEDYYSIQCNSPYVIV